MQFGDGHPPDCDENMALCYIMQKNFKAQAQPVTSWMQPINIMNIDGLASVVVI